MTLWTNRHQPWCGLQHQGPCPPTPASYTAPAARSVFAEPLAQAREALAIAWPEGDHAGPNVYTEALAALDLIEQRAKEMEDKAHERAKRASAITADAYQARVQRAERRAADMEKALRKRRKAGHNDTCDFVKAFDPPLPCSCGHDEMCAALSAREEAP